MMVKYKIYDKTSSITSGLYGTRRFKNSAHENEVYANHAAILSDMGGKSILMLKHVFGTEVIDADTINDFTIEPDGDAAVTAQPGVILCVQTADCLPLLLISENKDVIGAAHCSWHTLKDGIVKKIIDKMMSKGAAHISAILGPAIQQKSYEVDTSFREKILSQHPDTQFLFAPGVSAVKWFFDLAGFCILQLEKCGVKDIKNVGEDTYSNHDRYYSYRRDMHNGIQGEKTNILSAILIQNQ